jgi:hypothetical protein
MSATRAIALIVLIGCGGTVATSSSDGGTDSMLRQDAAGWTACTSPSGARICGGPSACPDTSPTDEACRCEDPSSPPPTPDALRLCVPTHTSAQFVSSPDLNCGRCPDGLICASLWVPSITADFCVSYDYGVLYAGAGATAPNVVRYADESKFTSTPLPIHESCPSVSGVQLCGPGCGTCPPDRPLCSGRSPTHPYSWCIVDPRLNGADPFAGVDTRNGYKGVACAKGSSCFVYATEPETQEYAKASAICLPTPECQAVAANLPGGGTCYSPPSCGPSGCGCFQPN